MKMSQLMRPAVQTCTAVFLFCISENALADEDVEQEPFYPVWMLAAGVGFGGVVVGTAGSIGVLGASTAGFMVERRVAHELWLLARGSAWYSTQSYRTDPRFDGDARARQGGGEGALGLRYVFTPDAPFQLSSYATIGAGYWGARDVGAEQDSWHGDVYIGFAVDRELTEGLGVRLSTQLANVRYGHQRFRFDDGSAPWPTVDSDDWTASLMLQPSLELRFSF